ncbi:Imm51 family immunity protein [Nocardia thailandica]|uniref:Imm51 family immunity protein n=1 Tax=Nocardia thailandica TaxID=257275 RepID=UPI00030F3457|nr:Imm51 family immunity protein [Nocardia thailandica]
MTDRTSFAPLVFFEYDHKPGTFCLMLGDGDMTAGAEVFAEAGYEPGGYGWTGVARAALALRAPQLSDRVRFDPEAGMMVAYGTDADALRTLGSYLQEALRDTTVLAGFLAAGDPEWYD